MKALQEFWQLVKEHGLGAVVAGTVLVGGVAVIFFKQVWLGVSMVAIALAILLVIYFHKSRRVQVIAWNGWDNPELHGSLARHLDFLMYERGFDRLPNLQYGRRPFDLMVVDFACVEANHRHDRIKDMQQLETDDIWDGMPRFLQSLAMGTCRKGKKRLALPVEFGFSELLVRPSAFDGQLGDALKSFKEKWDDWQRGHSPIDRCTSISYKDFDLLNLLAVKPELRIGVWDWYLPSLLHLLLLDARPGELISDRGISAALSADQSLLARATEPLRAHPQNFVLLGDPRTITQSLNTEDLDIIIGSGSSAFPLLSRRNMAFVPLVPREGVYTWMNCVTVVYEADYGWTGLGQLIKSWFSPEVQKILSESAEYRALPALRQSMLSVNSAHPALPTLHQVTDKVDFQERFPGTLAARNMPASNYRLWQHVWENAAVHPIIPKSPARLR